MESYWFTFFIFAFGAVIGSFLAALSYRLPREISILRGRSFCPKCKKKIPLFLNIPIISFFLLGGRTRCCNRPLSPRYPLIETVTAILFVIFWQIFVSCGKNSNLIDHGAVCEYKTMMGVWALPFLFLVLSALVIIFVTDLEYQLIPDTVSFFLFFLTLTSLILWSEPLLFTKIFWGFFAATLLLILHLVTRGRGMGLGDVKLAIFAGVMIGYPKIVSFFLLSFWLGGLVGLILIFLKQATLKKRIAFGPFLIISLIITLIWGNIIDGFFF